MENKKFIVDLSKISDKEAEASVKEIQLLYKLNHTLPLTEEYDQLLNELFDNNLGRNSTVRTPLSGVAFNHMKIGDNVFINSNCLAMARGGIIIEDGAMLAANVQLLSNNHDEYQRHIITCEEILIKKGAWIGAGASILPGVTIGKYAIIGAGAIVTKDVPDYTVVVGSPARVVRTLDEDKFED